MLLLEHQRGGEEEEEETLSARPKISTYKKENERTSDWVNAAGAPEYEREQIAKLFFVFCFVLYRDRLTRGQGMQGGGGSCSLSLCDKHPSADRFHSWRFSSLFPLLRLDRQKRVAAAAAAAKHIYLCISSTGASSLTTWRHIGPPTTGKTQKHASPNRHGVWLNVQDGSSASQQ